MDDLDIRGRLRPKNPSQPSQTPQEVVESRRYWIPSRCHESVVPLYHESLGDFPPVETARSSSFDHFRATIEILDQKRQGPVKKDEPLGGTLDNDSRANNMLASHDSEQEKTRLESIEDGFSSYEPRRIDESH